MIRLDPSRPVFNAGLLGLSLRRAGYHCGRQHTPQPPTNETRYRAWRDLMPVPKGNDHQWPFRA